MLNKLLSFVRQYDMLQAGDRVVCAVSGGADSVALLFALYLLSEKLQVTVEAAHFNHMLRGEESDRDEIYVRELCDRLDIPLHIGRSRITAGNKGLEAAARDARYAFLRSIPGKIATAHTADDNAETMLMHLVRGTGLKGLGGITPVRDNLIRPMLTVTREEVVAFLVSYNLSWVSDSSNDTDAFLRNRIRHHLMPLLREENPNIARSMSLTALRLRQDEDFISDSVPGYLPDITQLRSMHSSVRARLFADYLRNNGLPDTEASHLTALEQLVFSDRPSASASFPNGIIVRREYDRLICSGNVSALETQPVECPGVFDLPLSGVRVTLRPAINPVLTTNCFTVYTCGQLYLRSRNAGDSIRLSGGTKDLKKLYIDRKIPAALRGTIPVLTDECGVLGVYGIGANLDRISGDGLWVEVLFEEID